MNTSRQPLLSVRSLVKEYSGSTVVSDVSFELFPGELMAILGPSGCGKSTLLQMIAGLTRPESGSIIYAKTPWVDGGAFVPPEQRDCGMVFQDMALFPHLSVAGNIGFSIERSRKRQVVASMLELVGLPEVGRRMVHQLSGGQQQRVALARSLAPNPGLLLLDEPFSSLDLKLRNIMRREVRKILKRQKVTAILVTHDQSEAFAFADTVAVMFAGRFEQQADSYGIYRNPANRNIASFVGDANFLPMEQALECFGELDNMNETLKYPENTFMCRPHNLQLSEEDACATVSSCEFQGEWQHLQLDLDCGGQLDVHSRQFLEPGLRVSPTVEQGCIYSPQGELIGLFGG
ncbi:MAG: hypothetical protein CSA20_07900 [Deltaproteobacteria bacterium]|nr:MAG: hypothetical protein CSB23_04355 [Deltaproteobacteria bacterium]PIE72457.1 MAG: hypothetical protein CSA20_07900 [Deltaproteobacteria bacterium]